jgi:hypothetical protein
LGTLRFGVTPLHQIPSEQNRWVFYVDGFLSGERSVTEIQQLWRGFGYDGNVVGIVGNGVAVFVPHWLFCLIFFSMPSLWVLRWRWARRPARGTCASCGYNLTGNVSGVCPECGKPLPKRTEISN